MWGTNRLAYGGIHTLRYLKNLHVSPRHHSIWAHLWFVHFYSMPSPCQGLCHIIGSFENGIKIPLKMAILCECSGRQKGKTTSCAERSKSLNKNSLFRKCWLSWLWRGHLAQRSISVTLGGPQYFEFILGDIYSQSLPQRDPIHAEVPCVLIPNCSLALKTFQKPSSRGRLLWLSIQYVNDEV